MQGSTNSNNTVSVRQLVMVFIFIMYSPIVRFLPSYAAKNAKEAGWVSAVPALIPTFVLIYFMHVILNKGKGDNLVEIIKDILGIYVAKLALIIHLMWVLFLLGFYLRISGERLVSSIYPNVNITFFIVVNLIVISYILRSGATTIARMGEILLPILIILYLFVTSFLFAKIRRDAIFPVYFNDIGPILKASVGTLSMYSMMFLLFFFSDKIIGKKNITKTFFKGSLVLFGIISILLVTTIGTLGSSVTVRAPIPFLLTAKQISVMDTIENIESFVVALWLLTDTVLIAVLTVIFMNIAKHVFGIKEPKRLINIFFVFLFILALGIASNRIEIDLTAHRLLPVLNPIIGFGTPTLLFVVGKLRRRL